MSIGWIPFSMIVFGEGPGDNGLGVGVGSPLFGVRMYTARLGGEGMPHEFVSQALWTGFWTIAYAGIAIALLLATLATFNRCLGRIDEASIFDEDRVAVRPRVPQVAEVQTTPPIDLAASDAVLSSPGTDS